MTVATPTHPDATECPEGLIAQGCRVLAFRGLAEDILGHISFRVAPDQLMVRCRGPRERGLLFTDPEDVKLLDFDDDQPSEAGYRAPNELPIHREVMRARPDVAAVVHVHPPAVIAADLAGLGLRPIVGAYNIPAMRMAHEGVPVYPRGLLINSDALARDVVAVLGDKPACVLRGHGIVAVGDSVEQAVVRALNIDALARITLQAASAMRSALPELPVSDIESLPDLGSGFNDSQVWLSNVARLEHSGLAL